MTDDLLIDSDALERHQKMIHYGLMGETLVGLVKELLVERKVLDMPEVLPEEMGEIEILQRESLLCPPAFKECKVPSARGLFDGNGVARENPSLNRRFACVSSLFPWLLFQTF